MESLDTIVHKMESLDTSGRHDLRVCSAAPHLSEQLRLCCARWSHDFKHLPRPQLHMLVDAEDAGRHRFGRLAAEEFGGGLVWGHKTQELIL
jgi:hypothetical protein